MENESIDPWGSKALTDYGHVFKEFGLSRFPEKISEKLDHYFFERKIVIAHRDFEKVLARIESKKPFINITGIASSGFYHLGHKVDIDLFLYFKSLGAKNYFSVSDIDAYCSREDSKIPSLKKAKEFAVSNVQDLLAFGLLEKDLYVQSGKENRYFEFSFEASKKITRNTFEAVYGHIDLGKISANLLQYADILHTQLPEFEGKMPSITGIGLDQDPHARLTRDIAKRLAYPVELPSFVYFEHQSGLMEGTKMSSSNPETAIFLNDSLKDVKKKISNTFTGGKPTAEEQRKLGGNISICKKFEVDKFHLKNSKELGKICENCVGGKWLCGECKQYTIQYVSDFLEEHQRKTADAKKTAEKIVYGK